MEYQFSQETQKTVQKIEENRQERLELKVVQNAAADERMRLNKLRLAPVSEQVPFFAGLSLLFGVCYTFCLYENPCGITYPLFTAIACLCGILACRKLNVPIKKESWFLIAAALLLGIATCRTGDFFLILMNGLALVLLGSIFAIHQFYEESAWNIGKYLCSIILYLAHAIGAIGYPFRHLSQYVKKQENGSFKRLSLFLSGLAIAVPILAVVTALLGAADAVFSSVMHRIVFGMLNPVFLFRVIFQTLFGTLAFYCLTCSCCLHGLKEEVANRRKGEPLAAAACMGAIAVVYLIFCGIQVIYLFLGKGTLPEGYTYSSYARQGFFQLLFVAFLNLVMVLCCLKYIRPHRTVQVLLTVICGCTYIMIASAFYRMMLYVGEYHLSYLRVLVFWFLAMLAVLMTGVTCMIWKETFPLFRFGLAVVSVFYVCLALARPEAVIARDYVSRLTAGSVTETNLYYLTHNLSTDAAPAIASLHLTEEDLKRVSEYTDWTEYFQNYFENQTGMEYEELGIRNYNFSYGKAGKLFP